MWLACLALLTPALAEASAPAWIQESGSLEQARGTLRERRLSWLEKVEAMDRLLAGEPADVAELAEATAKAAQALEKSLTKTAERLERDFARAASGLAEDRLDRATREAMEQHRARWLAASRDKDLSKAQVHEVCDPAHEALREILDVRVVQVWDADAGLEEDWVELVRELDDWLLVHDYWRVARDLLLVEGAGWERKSYIKKELVNPEAFEANLLAALERAARLATVMPDRDRNTLLANEPLLAQLEEEEAAGIRELNRIRIRAGLAALRVDLKLCEAGRGHSQDMVEHQFFAHESPVEGKKTPGDRAAEAGTSGSAENIAAGQSSGWGAIQAWWTSPGHHRNMMGGHARVGLGRHQNHWTQMFGG